MDHYERQSILNEHDGRSIAWEDRSMERDQDDICGNCGDPVSEKDSKKYCGICFECYREEMISLENGGINGQ